MNGKTAEEAVKKAQNVGLPMGLHFNISEGISISDPASIPTLITSKSGVAQFHGKEGFIFAEKNGTVSVDDVERELRAQVGLFDVVHGSWIALFCLLEHVQIMLMGISMFTCILVLQIALQRYLKSMEFIEHVFLLKIWMKLVG